MHRSLAVLASTHSTGSPNVETKAAGTQCYDIEELQVLFAEFDRARAQGLSPQASEADEEMEVFYLRPFEISATRFRAERAFQQMLRLDADELLRDVTLDDSRLAHYLRISRLESDLAFNKGRDLSRTRDAGNIALIDFAPIFRALSMRSRAQ